MANRVVNYYLSLIYHSKTWILVVIGVFLIGVLWGVIISLNYPNVTSQILSQYASSINFEGQSSFSLTTYIFQRNYLIVTIATFASIILGFPSIFVSFVNGLILGLVLSYQPIYQLFNPFQILMLLLPHGLFEYTAVFLSLSFGLRLGLNWIFASRGEKKSNVFQRNLRETFFIFILVSFLLLLAAIIEGFLTERIACLLARVCR